MSVSQVVVMPSPFQNALRVMTYNVHGCVGLDFRRSEKRVAEVIAATNTDVVGLQELDLGRRRSKGIDQPALIAEHLGFHRYFHPAMQQSDEHYGDAILSRWPITLRKAGGLPSQNAFLFKENRAALWIEIATPYGPLQVFNTHWGLGTKERIEQAQALIGPDWVGAADHSQPLVLLGDFNSRPKSAPYRLLCRKLGDASLFHTDRRHSPTFPTVRPLLALDHIFHNASVHVKNVFVEKSSPARIASDHFPLIADIALQRDTDSNEGSPVISV